MKAIVTRGAVMELSSAVLIAVDADSFEVIGPVATLDEAREIATEDLRMRDEAVTEAIDNDTELPMCPEAYQVHSRGRNGCYFVVEEWPA